MYCKIMSNGWDFCDSATSATCITEELTKEQHLCITCKTMLEFLKGSRLEVGVNRENCTRVVISQNTKWYQDFCACYTSCSWIYRNGKKTRRKKRVRTFIKRCDTISALKRMVNGNYSGEYAERLSYYVEIFWDEYANHY